MSNALSTITNDIYALEPVFNQNLADKSLSFDREASFAVQIITANDYVMNTAMKNRQSLVNAVTNIASIGISLNPAKKEAYLVPRDGKICLDISYMGLIQLAIDTGSIKWAKAEAVYQEDRFVLHEMGKQPTHERNPFSKDRGDIVGVYVVAKTADGDYLTDCMSREEIENIMNRSQSVKSGKSSPWKTDYAEMAKKTVVKRAYKYWPKTDRLDQAIHYLNTDGDEGLAAAEQVDHVTEWLERIKLADKEIRKSIQDEAKAFFGRDVNSYRELVTRLREFVESEKNVVSEQ